jgi:hypothetical protein
MGIESGNLTIHHGTPKAFDQVTLPDPSVVDLTRHGGDQYGIGFYVATDPDITAAKEYARTYATGRGLVLEGNLKAGSYALLNLDEPLGQAIAEQLKDRLTSIKTGNPDLDRYYREIAEKVTPELTGKNVWNQMSGLVNFENSVKKHQAIRLDKDMVTQELKSALNTLLGKLDTHGIDLTFGDPLTEKQITTVREELGNVSSNNPHVKDYLEEVAADINPQNYSRTIEKLRRIDAVESLANSKLPVLEQRAAAQVLDQASTHVLNDMGMHGIIVPHENTAVFKGAKGIEALPDLKIIEIVGNGPTSANLFVKGELKVDEVLVPKKPGHALSIEGKRAISTSAQELGGAAKGVSAAAHDVTALARLGAGATHALNSGVRMLPLVGGAMAALSAGQSVHAAEMAYSRGEIDETQLNSVRAGEPMVAAASLLPSFVAGEAVAEGINAMQAKLGLPEHLRTQTLRTSVMMMGGAMVDMLGMRGNDETLVALGNAAQREASGVGPETRRLALAMDSENKALINSAKADKAAALMDAPAASLTPDQQRMVTNIKAAEKALTVASPIAQPGQDFSQKQVAEMMLNAKLADFVRITNGEQLQLAPAQQAAPEQAAPAREPFPGLSREAMAEVAQVAERFNNPSDTRSVQALRSEQGLGRQT